MSLEKEIIDFECNRKDIEKWVTLKGEYRYKEIIDFLNEKNIECTWANVTYYIKYDKRILINSFKYIVFLEELFKSFIYNNSELKKSVLGYDFRVALNNFLLLGDKANYDEMDLDILSKERTAINKFRNSVVHNKILINRLYDGKTLEEVLIIFNRILPKTYRDGFSESINSCSKGITDNKWNIKI